jgi:hypothetical protein
MEICRSIEADSLERNDTARLRNALAHHLSPVFENVTEQEYKQMWEQSHYRLQRICGIYDKIFKRLVQGLGDWKRVDKKPEPVNDQTVCSAFKKHDSLSYLENNGDTVVVTFKDGIWEDHFKDGTYSRLKIHWLNNCEFSIEFIESNNISRKNYSKPGDRYVYSVIEGHYGYYLMAVTSEGLEQYSTFKFYF